MTRFSPKKLLTMLVLVVVLAGGLYAFTWVRGKLGEETTGTGVAAEVEVAGITCVAREVSVPVLLYHGIVEEADGSNVTVEDFQAQMDALEEGGYSTVDTHDLLSYYTEGAQLPAKPVVIAFDDGRKDSYLNGGPVLAEHGFKAVMFVITGKQESEDPFFVSWDELAQMHASGMWDIEAHGYNTHTTVQIDAAGNTGHSASNKMWLLEENRLETDEEYKQRLLGDLRKAKSDLESHLEGTEVDAFAFPFGDFGQESVNMDKKTVEGIIGECVSAFYPIAFEVGDKGWDFNNYEDSDFHFLQRLMVTSDMSADELLRVLDGTQPRALPFMRSQFSAGDLCGLCCDWGEMSAANGALALQATPDGTGALALLYGGHYWRDYAVEAEISLDAGDNAYLIGRYKNNSNYVVCKVDGKSVALMEKVGDEDRILGSADYAKQPGHYTVRLSFAGDTVSCEVDGAVAFGPAAIDPSLSGGGVGFEVWDPRVGLASGAVWKLSVTQVSPPTDAG
jgi:peptidoglycan/xylan/chitin deacetylase (PgdA/CDA1 family)